MPHKFLVELTLSFKLVFFVLKLSDPLRKIIDLLAIRFQSYLSTGVELLIFFKQLTEPLGYVSQKIGFELRETVHTVG